MHKINFFRRQINLLIPILVLNDNLFLPTQENRKIWFFFLSLSLSSSYTGNITTDKKIY